MRKTLLASTILALASAPVWAGVVTDSHNNQGPLNATGNHSPETLAQLANTEVIFNFGSFSTTAYFNTSGQASDSANDGILSVAATNGYWDLTNNSGGPALDSVTIIGASPGGPGRTAFDSSLEATCSPDPSLCPVNASAVYTDPIGLNGAAPNGTLYGKLTLTFNTPLSDQSGFDFKMNSSSLAGPITAGSSAPEPASFVMLLGGLCFAGGVLRRKK